jgi:hypothetical protein
MCDWHFKSQLGMTSDGIPPHLMPPTLGVSDCMEVNATYGIGELQWGMELIVSEPIYPDSVKY